ncbi:MAG: RNA methyltransferase [Tidjanibacter sp.]|nr:RNA methyltransferase [Tidjanibacter sp.]
MENTDNKPREWYEERIAYLAEFMLPERYTTMRRVVADRTRYMTVCAENTFHPQNASAIVRHCEAFGVQHIHAIEFLCGFSPNLHIVRGTDKWVDIHRYETTAEAIGRLKGEGYRIVAATPHSDDCTPECFDISRGPFCLVFGTEKQGISPEVMAAADEFIKIPMYGFVESLNVSACAAILIQGLMERLHRSDIEWRLSPEEQSRLLYRWMRESIKDDEGILRKGFGTDF